MRKSHRLPKGWTPEKGTPRTNKASAAREHEPITVERLERAVAFLALLLLRDGPVVLPLFERMERELAEMRAQQATVERAKAFLESYRRPPMQRNLLLTSDKNDAGDVQTRESLHG
jgi:hypothetical protein